MEQRQKGRGETNGPQQVGGDDGFRVRESLLLGQQLFGPHDTRIVDEDVQRRVARRELSRERADVGGVLDVEHKGGHARVCGSGLVERLLAAAGDDDVVSERVEGLCQTAADAGGSARDQDCVAGSFHGDK